MTSSRNLRECPASTVWEEVCAGVYGAGEAESLLEHAAHCVRCGPLLREASALVRSDIDPHESEVLTKLESASPDWQRRIAHQLRATGAPPSGGLLRRLWAPAFAVGFGILVAAAVLVFWMKSRPTPESLLAQAYADQRLFEMRTTGAKYGPLARLESERGAPSSCQSPSLLEAQAILLREFKVKPRSDTLLTLRGKADLLACRFDDALATFTQVLAHDGKSQDALIGAAYAHYARALAEGDESPSRNTDLGDSVDLLGRALKENPSNPVALFNQAIALQELRQYQSAREIWIEYLQIDKTGPWADEARAKLQGLDNLIQQHGSSSTELGGDSNNPNFQLRKFDEQIFIEDLPGLLIQAAAGDRHSAHDAMAKLDVLGMALLERHQDRWLQDFLREDDDGSNLDWKYLGKALESELHGDLEPAAKNLRLVISRFSIQRNVPGLLRARIELAYIDQRMQRGEDCLGELLKARDIVETREYPWLKIQSDTEWAVCSGKGDNFEEAQLHIKRALHEAEVKDYPVSKLRALGMLASFETLQGAYIDAWRDDELGLREFWQGQYPPVRAYQFYSDLSYIEEGTSRLYLSAWLHREALANIASLPYKSSEAVARFRLVKADLRAGYADEAAHQLASAIDMVRQVPNDRALKAYLVECSAKLASFYISSGDVGEARTLLANASVHLSEIQDSYILAAYQSALAQLNLQQGDVQRAKRVLASAIQRAETKGAVFSVSSARVQWQRQMHDLYSNLALAYLQSGDTASSAAIWERYHARSFPSLDRWTSGAFDADLIKNQFEHLRRQLQHETVLSYSVVEDGILIWLFDDRGITARHVPFAHESLRQLIGTFSEACQNPEMSEDGLLSSGRQLSSLLLTPIWSKLDLDRALIIETDTDLMPVSMAALPLSGDDFLGLKFELRISPTIGMMQIKRPIRALARKVLIVAAPKLNSNYLPLPDAEEEGEQISRLFQNSVLLSGANATSSNVSHALGESAVFHFAGHSQANAIQTKLLLSDSGPSGAENSTIDSSFFERHRPNASRLVVLAACSTGTGESDPFGSSDDLVVTLTSLGVPQIVATKWRVNSHSSMLLMTNFYAKLKQGLSVSKSLQASQRALALQSRYRHPYYWAPYFAVGINTENLQEIIK